MLPVADGPTSAAQTALTFFAVSWSSPPQMNSSRMRYTCRHTQRPEHTLLTNASAHVRGRRRAKLLCPWLHRHAG